MPVFEATVVRNERFAVMMPTILELEDELLELEEALHNAAGTYREAEIESEVLDLRDRINSYREALLEDAADAMRGAS